MGTAHCSMDRWKNLLRPNSRLNWTGWVWFCTSFALNCVSSIRFLSLCCVTCPLKTILWAQRRSKTYNGDSLIDGFSKGEKLRLKLQKKKAIFLSGKDRNVKKSSSIFIVQSSLTVWPHKRKSLAFICTDVFLRTLQSAPSFFQKSRINTVAQFSPHTLFSVCYSCLCSLLDWLSA